VEKKGSRQRDRGRRVGGRGGPASPPWPLLYRAPCRPWRPPRLFFADEQHEEVLTGRLRRRSSSAVGEEQEGRQSSGAGEL
jgi:hypothetical protein